MLSKTVSIFSQTRLRQPTLSPIGTFITDSPANISADTMNPWKTTIELSLRSDENGVAHDADGAADSRDDFFYASNPTLAQGKEHQEQRARSSTASVSQDSSDDGATLALPIHVALTIFILAGSSQIALHVSSVVQIWSILGSSISVI